MQNRRSTDRGERGQALVIMALAIVALVAVVGLAIDGGRIYEQRRQMQNGADAAAMAGARELGQMLAECGEPSAANDLRIAGKVLEFAALNGVDEASPDGDVTAWYVDKDGVSLGWVGAGGIPTGATGVAAGLVATDTTTFLRVVGQDHISAYGEATAMAGPVTAMGGGLLPIAVPKQIVDERRDDDSFLMMGNGDFCDITGCSPDTENPPQAQRGWLQLGHVFNQAYSDSSNERFRTFIYNLGTSGCTRPIIDNMDKIGVGGWAELGCDYPYHIYAGAMGDIGGDFIAGDTGAIASALHEVTNRIDSGQKIAVVPMFDYIYVGECKVSDGEVCMESVFGDKEPPGGWMTGTSKYYYHIVGFVTVELLDTKVSDKSITARFISQVVGDGVISPSSGLGSGMCQPAQLIGVVMWE